MIGSSLYHFRVTAQLGGGGMGEVYQAEDKLGLNNIVVNRTPEPL